VRRSPAASCRQATAPWLGRNRKAQAVAMAASPATIKVILGWMRWPSSPPTAPTPRVAAARQGRVRIQVAHSAARSRRHRAWAEPPGRPTVAVTQRIQQDGEWRDGETSFFKVNVRHEA
jgi:hypothetical protein